MIRDSNTKKLIVSHARVLRSVLAQGLGLMFRSRLQDEGWVFVFPKVSKWHITNLFVFQSIDVLWLDATHRVLQIKTLRPFRLHQSGIADTAVVIELPAGTAQECGIRLGDSLEWSKT